MSEQAIKPRRSVHRTQWAAQFAVASELCKRGYEVAFTMGNHPSVDIMATSPLGYHFGIDVKGLYEKNFWAVKPKIAKNDLYYILAYVPNIEPNQFFILDQATINLEANDYFAKALERARTKGRDIESFKTVVGVNWGFAAKFKDAWNTLPP